MPSGTIIYMGGFELPDKNAAAHRVLSNAKILRDLGFKVVFISVDKNLDYNTFVLKNFKLTQGFETWFVPYPKSNMQWVDYLCGIKTFLDVVNKYIDVNAVICYNYQANALIKIKNYCNKNKIKIIADCTEWYSTKGTNVIFKIIKGIDSFMRMRIIQRHLDGIIVISCFLENYYKKCKNVLRLPPLVDLSEEKWNLPVFKFDDNKIRFAYAGSPGKNKDKINSLIEIIHELEGLHQYVFYIIGITKEQYLVDHVGQKELIEELNNNIIFLGYLSHVDSLKYIKMADFSIFLRAVSRSTKAGFPTKFVESISCGTPVITTKTSDLQKYFTEGEDGYFLDINNKNIYLTQMNEIFNLSRDKIKKMKQNCLDNNLFKYEKYRIQMEDLLK